MFNSKGLVLVIGGAGYVGSVLVRKLLRRGYHVRVLDKLIYDNAASLADLHEQQGFSFMRGDLCDKASVEEAIKGVSAVVHLAALVGDPICKKYQDLARKVNLDGAIQVFDRLHGKNIKRFVFTSTCSNYGLRANDEPAAEDAELNPVSLYAETKVAFERYAAANAKKVDFCPVILRLSTAYGISSRMRFDLTISEFTRALALKHDLLVYDESTWRPYCHVEDISSAVILALESSAEKVNGEVFNVGSLEGNFTKKMVVDTLLKYLPDAVVDYKKGGTDPRNYKVSFDKIQRTLGFKADYTVEQSVAALMRAVQAGFFQDVETRKNFYGNYQVLV